MPLARREGAALSFVVTDHLGTSREVVSETGTLEWAAEYRTWGSVHRLWRPGREVAAEAPPEFGSRFGTEGALALAAPDPDPAFCPLRFQGQWADAETGLHYNRFRYYEPMVGGYVSPDPIGFVGGLRSYGYVEHPNGDHDPLGLNRALRSALGLVRGDRMQAHHVIPKEIWALNRQFFDSIGMPIAQRDVAANGIGLPSTRQMSINMGLPYHCGSHPIYSALTQATLQPIINDYNNGLIDAPTARTRVAAAQNTLRGIIRAMPGGQRVR